MQAVPGRLAATGAALALSAAALVVGSPAAQASSSLRSSAASLEAHPLNGSLATLAHAATSCSQAYLPLPDSACTPGVTNPDVTQDTINSTICVSGWTATVRPPASYTTALKIQQIGEYGYSDTSTADYEEDHLIPLELGGAPRDPNNLWPEPRYDTGSGYVASNKDSVENKLKTAVCNGTVQLADAQNAIATDWTTALQNLGLS